MPKVKKIRAAALAMRQARHEPLGQSIQKDIINSQYAPQQRNRHSSSTSRMKQRDHDNKNKKDNNNNDDDDAEIGLDNSTNKDNKLLDEKDSQRIMALSRVQRLEVEAEEMAQVARQRRPLMSSGTTTTTRHHHHHNNNNISSRQIVQSSADSDEDEEELDEDPMGYDNQNEDEKDDQDHDTLVEHDQGYVAIVDGTEGLSAEDEALIASMMNPSSERRTLADIILSKIAEKETEQQQQQREEASTTRMDAAMDPKDTIEQQLPPKVVEVYTEIGKILSRYTSGKLPKAFKVIPSLSNWEDVLYLTRPDLWTPQAMFAATRIFASNLNPKMAQRFYNLVLLDSVRADIDFNKKLNYHYYMALKKAVYKPAAFFKGILLPLAQDNCTLREAAIVASVLQRVSIPAHHSAVAIHKLAQMESYTGAASIFIKTLLNKKYSLPAPVIASLVRHFGSFLKESTTSTSVLPVLWHQSLLVFVQRYKHEVQGEQARELLRRVMRKHFHPKITPEIRRELFGAQAWRDERSSTDKASIHDSHDVDSMIM